MGDEIEARTFRTDDFDVLGADVGRRLQPKQDDFALEVTPKLADVRVVSIENSGAAVRQGLD